LMVRNVLEGRELVHSAGTVMKQFATWFYEKGYERDQERELAVERRTEAARDSPRVERLAALPYCRFAAHRPLITTLSAIATSSRSRSLDFTGRGRSSTSATSIPCRNSSRPHRVPMSAEGLAECLPSLKMSIPRLFKSLGCR
jgi:hypothetical protein